MTDAQLATAESLLKSVFGFPGFRPGQAEIVAAVAAGRDVLAVMPTGGGKSLCFQLPALSRPGLTLVVSPLIALMRDQVRALAAAGVAAGSLSSGNTPDEAEAVHAALERGDMKLLYVAPERLAAAGFAAFARRAGVTALAVDEAHCVAQWGHDFRPDYLRIGALRQALGVPVAAFTATADDDTRAEIVDRLFGGAEPVTFLRGFDRPNIRLAFAVKDDPRAQVLSWVRARRGQAGIVYCGTRAKTESLAEALRKAGHAALAYHAGLDPAERRRVETAFQQQDGLIVAATVAFGMGIDKPDIRWVMHADLPKTIEGYYQEIGRAGRDGAPAEAMALYGADDIRFRRQQIDEGAAPVERKAADHARLNALLGLAEAVGCRRQQLLGYFGETPPGPCGNCDHCARPPAVFDGTEAVRKALSAVARTGEWFGAGHLIDILTGTATPRVREKGHDALPTFAVGREMTKSAWSAVFRQMLGRDLIRPDPDRHGALRMTEAARPVLKGEVAVTLRRDSVERAEGPAPRAQVADEDAGLLSALKALRRRLAEAQGVPAYVVFPDRTLAEMAERRPATLDEMAQVSGVGVKKLETYGAAFLEVVTGAPPPPAHPARRALAGRTAGSLYDRLAEAQMRLMRGADGTGKPMSLSPGQLRRIAEARPTTLSDLDRAGDLGPARVERFGAAFLALLKAD
jgi:ATP-dependent DNA helicase RecQ